ncbi:MAG: hypothetical protein ACRD4S_04305 [Candidatus Acidiferrales bacterium]
MALGYDIFRKLDDGSPIWMGEAPNLDAAKKKAETLIRAKPAEYFIRDASTGEVIARITPGETC